jgi:hypothetical protein
VQRTCSEEGCTKPLLSRGWCRAHYTAWYKAQRQPTPCAIPDCKNQAFCRGWCRKHYDRWRRTGDTETVRHRHDGNRIDRDTYKTCEECGKQFAAPPHISHKQWAAQRCCSFACGNALGARGRPKKLGDLDPKALGGKAAYRLEWQRRRAMPQWAAWWEDRRRMADLWDLETVPVVYGKGAQRLASKPKTKHWIAGTCPECSNPVVVKRGWWNGSIRCRQCTKDYWQTTHRERAKRHGVTFDTSVTGPALFERDRWICQICHGRTIKKRGDPRTATIDHIVPFALGGSHTWDNVQTAHARCNFQKGSGAANDQLRLAV